MIKLLFMMFPQHTYFIALRHSFHSSIVRLIWNGCRVTSRDENDFLTHLRLLKRVVFLSPSIIEHPVQNTGNIGLLCEYGRVFV